MSKMSKDNYQIKLSNVASHSRLTAVIILREESISLRKQQNMADVKLNLELSVGMLA